jgi:hypothetical protein
MNSARNVATDAAIAALHRHGDYRTRPLCPIARRWHHQESIARPVAEHLLLSLSERRKMETAESQVVRNTHTVEDIFDELPTEVT